MMKNVVKFGAELMAAALAFAGATAANATDYTAANQDEFLEVAAKAVSGDRILLGEGAFAIGPVDIDGKTLTFKGAGEALTTVYIGNGGYDGNGGHGSNKAAKMTFEELTLDDLASDSGYLTGFTEAAGLTFRKVTFNVGFSNWGNKGGAVNFYDCTFNPVAVSKYNVQELRSASGTQFLFDGCVFNSAEGRFINAYKQGGAEADIGIVVKDCTFKNTGSAGKCALNLHDSKDGCTIALTFVGENKTEGEFPALNENDKPSKLFQTQAQFQGAGHATVMFKATDEDDPVVIYASNRKIDGRWIDPDGYTVPTAVAKVGETKYFTLDAALAAATDGKTLTLLRDVNANIVVPEGQELTLNLNGKTLDGAWINVTPTILNNGILTITDTSEEKTGAIERTLGEDVTGNDRDPWYVIYNNGTMVIDAANVNYDCRATGQQASMILNQGVMTINSGSFSNNEYTVVKNEAGTLTINGGRFDSGLCLQNVLCFGEKVRVNGGYFSYQVYKDNYLPGFVKNPVVLEVAGGTFRYGSNITSYLVDGADVVISDVKYDEAAQKFTATYTATHTAPEEFAAKIVRSTYTTCYVGDSPAADMAWTTGAITTSDTLEINVEPTMNRDVSYAMTFKAADGVDILKHATPAVGYELAVLDNDDGTKTLQPTVTEASAYAKIVRQDGAEVYYPTVVAAAKAILANETLVVLKNEALAGTSSSFISAAATPIVLDLNGKELTGSVAPTKANVTITVKDSVGTGIIHQSGSSPLQTYMTGAKVILESGTYDINLCAREGEILVKGGVYKGTSAEKEFNGMLGNGELIIQGGTFHNDPTAFVDAGYEVIENATEPKTWTVQEKKYAAYIGTTGYETIQAAVDAADVSAGPVTITISDGVHEEKVDLTKKSFTENDVAYIGGITLEAAEGADVTLTRGIFINKQANLSDIRIKGLTISPESDIPVYLDTAGNKIIRNIEIANCVLTVSSSASEKFGVYLGPGTASNLAIKGCTINGASSWAIDLAGNQTTGLVITGNTIQNGSDGIALFGALKDASVTDNTLKGGVWCALWDNNESGIKGEPVDYAGNTIVGDPDDLYAVVLKRGDLTRSDIAIGEGNTFNGESIECWALPEDGAVVISNLASAKGYSVYFNHKLYLGDETAFATLEAAVAADTSGDPLTIVNYDSSTMTTAPEGWEFKTEGAVTKLVKKATAVAKIGGTPYMTLDAAIKAAAAMDQAEEKIIELQSCEITESIKLPATLKNVTFRGQEDGTSVLKDMTINSSDGSAYTYENIWFDGVVFENSMVIVTGARTGIEVNKNWKFTGNTFRNLTQQGYSYLHFASLSAEEPAENFTFTGNVVDGSTFASAAALNISSVTGTIAFNDNDIKNLLWRPMNIQINNHDGVADTLTVTGNKFGICGSMPQMLTRFEDGYDPLRVRINQNVFGGNVATGFALGIDNPETLDGDVTHNYYSSATTRIYVPNDYVYFDSDAATDLPHADNTCFSYYTGLTEDGEIDPATLVEIKKVAVAKIGETTYPTLAAAVEAVKAGWTVTLVADCDEAVTGGSVPFVLEKGGKNFTGSIAVADGFKTVASPIAGDDSVRYMPADEDPVVTAEMTKVASGFYQSGANYGVSADFYITSKTGLECFRDIINNLNGEAAAYRDSAAGAGFDLTAHRFSGKTISLLADVDLDNETWTPIGRATDRDMLAGTFDGNNHVVGNLKTVYTTEGKDQAGFFGYSNKYFTIKNLTLRNVDIKGFAYVGALISTGSKADSEIVNCHVIGSVSITAVGSYVGCIVGHGNCSVSNCSVEATGGTGISVTGGGICVGGIYGYAANTPGDITDCSVSGLSISLAQNYVAGGIVGGVDRPLTVSGCSVEDVAIECQRGPYLGYVVGSIQGGDGILAIADCTVENSTLFSHVDKYTEKEETYLVQCGAYDAPTCYYVGSDVETDGNGKVVGGTFEWLPDGLVATGYEKVAQGTTPETWVVQEKPAPVVPIAEIVGKEGSYTSLDDAILAAGANDVIRMLADADVGDVMGAYRSQKGYAYKLPGNLTIDLGNHEVKLGSVALYESDDGGKLLFENGKININGAMGVAMEANDAASVFYVGKQGTLEFNAVEIVGTDVAASVVFRTYTLNAPLMRFDGCTIAIDGCNDFVHAIQRVEFEDSQVQIKNNKGRVFLDNDGHDNDGGSRVTLLRSSVSVDGISGNGGEDVNAIVLDASSLSFKNYQTESMGANKCNIELKNGSSFVLDGVGSHGFTNGKLVVNPGCTVDVKNVAYLGLNVTDGSIFKAGSKVSVANCCATTKKSMTNYYTKDIAMWSSADSGSVVIEKGADVKIDGRLIVKSGSLAIADGQYKKVELEKGTLTLTGGVYVNKPDDSYVAEGYSVQANVDVLTKDDYPWAVAKEAFVPAKEKDEDEKPAVIEIDIKQTEKQAETPEMVPVVMSAEAVATMVENGIIVSETPAQPKASEVMTGLAKKQDNQQTVWQNYVMGVDGTDTENVIATIGEKAADKPEEVVVVKTPIKEFNPPQNTGVTVTYRLMKSFDNKNWEVFKDGLAKPELDVDTSKLELGDTLWKFEAVFSAQKPKAK